MVDLKHEIILTAKFSQSTVAGNFQRCKILQKCLQTLKKKAFILWNEHATLLTFNVYVPHANLTKQRSNVYMFMANIMTSSIYTLVHFSFARKLADPKKFAPIENFSLYSMYGGRNFVCMHCVCIWTRKNALLVLYSHYVEYCEFHTVGLNASKTKRRARAG